MKHPFLTLLGIVLATGLAFVVFNRPGAAERVYTVAQVHAAMAHDPQAWVGRTILVRGTAVGLLPSSCLPAVWCSVGLVQPGAPDRSSFVPLVPKPADPLVAFVRGVALVGHVVPPPQRLHWGTPAIYRVQIHAVSSCAGSSCFDALLLDAAPLSV